MMKFFFTFHIIIKPLVFLLARVFLLKFNLKIKKKELKNFSKIQLFQPCFKHQLQILHTRIIALNSKFFYFYFPYFFLSLTLIIEKKQIDIFEDC